MLGALDAHPVLLGVALGLSLAVPPGPIMALAADRAVHRGYWPGVSVCLGAIGGDALLALLMAFGVVQLLAAVPVFAALLTLGGAGLMAFFAWGAWRTARRPPELGAHVERSGLIGRVPGWAAGFVLAVTSPFNFGWWIGTGTSLFRDYGPTIFVGFFAALFGWVFLFIALLVWTHRRVKGLVRVVSYASAVLLALFALLLLWTGAADLASLLTP